MAGLIESKLPGSDKKSNQTTLSAANSSESAQNTQDDAFTTTAANQGGPEPAGYDPERIELDPEKDTVEGRVEGIIAKNSPLMQNAQTRADQQSNRRGLMNSSMAVGAGQRAVLDAATPIAQQDAQTSFQTKSLNQQAGNRALEFGASSRNQFGLQEMSGDQALEQIGAQGDVQSRLQQERGEIDKELQSADAETRERLLNRQAEIDKELQELSGEQALEQIGSQGEVEQGLMERQSELQANRDEILNQFQRERDEALAADTLERDELLAEAQARRDDRLAENEQALQELVGEQNIGLQELRGEQSQQLAELENEYGNLRRASESAASFYNNTANAIGNILSNPDMETGAKNALVDKQLELLRGGLDVIGGISNLDLNDLLNEGDWSPGDPRPNIPDIDVSIPDDLDLDENSF